MDNLDEVLAFRASTGLARRVDELAQKIGRNRSDALRRLVEEALEARGLRDAA